jgi:hypothetical protein
MSTRALDVLRYLAAHNDPQHVAESRSPWTLTPGIAPNETR